MPSPSVVTALVHEGDDSVLVAGVVAAGPWITPSWNTVCFVDPAETTPANFTVHFSSPPGVGGGSITCVLDITWLTTSVGFDTFGDILSDMLDRAGEDPTDTDAATYYATAERQLNRAYQDLCNTHPFLFLRADPPAVIRTLAPITGIVEVTQDDDDITFSATIATSMAGRKILVGTGPEWYRIVTHTAGQAAATLDCDYIAASAPAAAFVIFQDEYDLSASNIRHLESLRVAATGRLIPGMPEARMSEQYPTPTGNWPPTHYARMGESKIRFAQYPTQAGRIEVAHTVIPDDISTPGVPILVPRNWRYVLSDGGLYFLLTAMDDARATAAATAFGGSRELCITDDLRKRFELSHEFRRGR